MGRALIARDRCPEFYARASRFELSTELVRLQRARSSAACWTEILTLAF